LKLPSGESGVEVLVEVLRSEGFDDLKIGLDEGGVAYHVFTELKEKLPKATLEPASKIFREIRMVKTEEEVRRLRKAVEITEKSFYLALEHACEGVSEIEFARIFEVNVVESGGSPFLTMFGFGGRSAFPNCIPTNNRLRKGDVIRFDGGCMYQHYCSDIAFTVFFGKPGERYKKYYRALAEGVKRAIEIIRPGIKASEIFRVAVEHVKKHGIPHYKRHHCGHGIGVEVYDPPILRPVEDTVLEEGMVLCVETPYYELGFGGLQVEKTILVTSDGYEYLSTPLEDDLNLTVV